MTTPGVGQNGHFRRPLDGSLCVVYTLVMNLHSLRPKTTAHFLKTMRDKGFAGETVIATLKNPTEVYPSRSHPGQWRVTGNGICIVGKPDGDRFVLITIYADRIVTPVRPDQLNTPEGRNFAKFGRQGLDNR